LTQAIAKAIGWDGTGNPLAPPPEAPATQRADVDDPAQVPSSLLASRTITLPTAQDEPLGSGPTEVQTAASSEETTDEEEVTAADEQENEVEEQSAADERETEVDQQETEVEEDLGDDLLEQENDEPTGNQYGVVRTNGPDNQTDDETAADEQSGSAGSGNASKSEAGDNDAADATSSE
ncbi:hypothetical protein ABQF26_31900, partial [Mycolicibacterium elephantis]